MTVFLEGKPADFESQVRPFVEWLKHAAWSSTDEHDKINASKAIMEIWDWAENLLNDESPENERFLSESPKKDGTPSDFELLKDSLAARGLKPSERKMMQCRVRATEEHSAKRQRLTLAFLAETELPVEYHSPEKAFYSVMSLMATKNQTKAQTDFKAFLIEYFPDTQLEHVIQRFNGTYLQNDNNGKLIWKPGAFKAIRSAVMTWRKNRQSVANRANASKPPAPGKRRGRPRKD
jgi:hypothetical protein